ncbi:MAG: hypothetical protein HYR73_08880 [Candidatus Eisenbacteria bacterium]|nr:hypothetical protein [Candidatus Eisenbacteria bacterium]
MSPNVPSQEPLPQVPYAALRVRLLEIADDLLSGGQSSDSSQLREAVESWWEEQQRWEVRVSHLLGLHHEINNALVGVRGNTQLLMMGPAGQEPGVREKLEVVIRESGRIREAALRLRELKAALHGTGSSARAA